ncbi:hypothetical protein FKOIJHOC_00079 [Acinetobacter phage Ab_121]|nr:hypothetical protein FKOIJHOC_00079 [Acinetobacter phage Ab_121]
MVIYSFSTEEMKRCPECLGYTHMHKPWCNNW